MTCTIFKNIYDKTPNYILVDTALERIKAGKSKVLVTEIRAALDKENSNELKKSLPSVCFSGKFKERLDKEIIEHSGFLVLDFDNVPDISEKMGSLCSNKYVYAAWVSPGGYGIKALIRIADGKQHRAHFAALKELFPDADNSGVNESRVCYESYDPSLFKNPSSEVFAKTTVVEKIESREIVNDEAKIFSKLLKWITNKGGSFSKGERNIFIYKLASACCRFGISQESAEYMIISEYPTGNDFTQKEAGTTIKSAYKSNNSKQGSAIFDREILIDKATRREVELPKDIDINAPAKDIIYGSSVKENALNIYNKGYEKVTGLGIEKLDELFKAKRGEMTGLTGIGNYGKSAFLKWFFAMRVLLFGEKYAAFVPEDNPAEEYYHDFVEILLGRNCTPFKKDGVTANEYRPGIAEYSNAYDFISRHIFYLYPKDSVPTPDYILEAFLEMIIKEKVSGICVDPWNQLAHSYAGRGDQYLEAELGKFHRFGQVNDVYNFIVNHPTKMIKHANGNFPCPDIYDMNGGAMWNNKLDNLLVYHRPMAQSDPNNPTAELHTKKIKRQKIVGKKGILGFEYNWQTRRFTIDGVDPMAKLIDQSKLSFLQVVTDFKPYKPQEQTDQMKRFLQNFQSVRDPSASEINWNQ